MPTTISGSGITTGTLDTSAEAISTTELGNGAIIQVKNIHFNSGIANTDHPAQSSSQSWWEYDNANLRLGITPTSTSNKILVIGHVSVGASASTHLSVRLYRRLASGTGATIGQNTATNGTCRLAISMMHIDQTNATYTMPVNFYDTPANTTDEHVYYYAFTHNSSSTRLIGINRSGDDSNNGDHTRATSGITLMEVVA